jgi:hypothetical protein
MSAITASSTAEPRGASVMITHLARVVGMNNMGPPNVWGCNIDIAGRADAR